MRSVAALAVTAALFAGLPITLPAQGGAAASPSADPVRVMVGRLDLDRYKATVKGLTQFGDRRQGTDRNRAAVDWIEAQLKSYGCTNTERIKYTYTGRQVRNDSINKIDPPVARGRAAGAGTAATRDTSAGARGRGRGAAATSAGATGRAGGRNPVKGYTARTGVNMDPTKQPDTALVRIDAQPDTPGEREEVYCTKIGTTHPGEMYIVGGHMDGHGYGAAANDDGSG
ncbi:MAG TPA: hypothetical protein VHW65_12790, partial [Gemmatimonadales bacterium]|nr:hypothetical protein [Gemmatimonadales bacterium]